MPAWIKTPHDEQRWSRARELAAQEGHGEDWSYVTGIYKRMNGGGVASKTAWLVDRLKCAKIVTLAEILARAPRGVKPSAGDLAYQQADHWLRELDLHPQDRWHGSGATADVVPLRPGRRWLADHGSSPVVGRFQGIYRGLGHLKLPNLGRPLGNAVDFVSRVYGKGPVIVPQSKSLRPSLAHTEFDRPHHPLGASLVAQVQPDMDFHAIDKIHPAAQKAILRSRTADVIREHGLYADPMDLRPDQLGMASDRRFRLADGVFRTTDEVRGWKPQLLGMDPDRAAYHLTRGLDFHPGSPAHGLIGAVRRALGAKQGSEKKAMILPPKWLVAMRLSGTALDDAARLAALARKQDDGEEPVKQAGPFDFMGAKRQAEPEAYIDLLRARSAYNRSRLRYQSTFRKLEPKAQKEILSAYDRYHGTMEQAILSGKIQPGAE